MHQATARKYLDRVRIVATPNRLNKYPAQRSRVVSSSAWPSPGRCASNRRRCCSTSRPPHSTPRWSKEVLDTMIGLASGRDDDGRASPIEMGFARQVADREGCDRCRWSRSWPSCRARSTFFTGACSTTRARDNFLGDIACPPLIQIQEPIHDQPDRLHRRQSAPTSICWARSSNRADLWPARTLRGNPIEESCR